MAGWRARSARITWLIPLAFLALLFRRALSPQVLLTRRDAYFLYLPLKQFLSTELGQGRLPTWYPFDGLGVSYVGFSIGGLFHPLNLLYLLLSADQGLKWQTLLSYPIAALGALGLARRLGAPRAGRILAAIGFAASGYLLSVSNNLPYLLTASALPWTLLAAERVAQRPNVRSAALLAGALLLALVGGDMQGFLLQGVAATAVVLLARRRRIVAKAVALGEAGAMAALAALPLLLPIWSTFQGSARGVGLSIAAATNWALHPLRLLELGLGPLVPPQMITDAEPVNNALGGSDGAIWAQAELLGLPLCALALAALLRPLPRRLKVHAGIGALALILALGRLGGLYRLFYKVVPLWAAFRYPEKLMPFAALALALLAAWGMRRLMRADRRATRLFVAGLAGLVALLVVASPGQVGSWLSARLKPDELPDAGALSVHLRSAVVVALVLLAALAGLSVKGGRWTGWVAVALNAAQVLLLSSAVVGLGPRSEWLGKESTFKARAQVEIARGAARLCWDLSENEYAHPPKLSAELRMLDAALRSLGLLSGATDGIGGTAPYGPASDGFFAQACARALKCPSPCSRVAGAGIGIVDRAQFEAMAPATKAELEVLASSDDPAAILFRDPRARPFASLPAVRHLPAAQVKTALLDSSREPAAQAILVGEGLDAVAAQGTLSARWVQPDRVEAEAELTEPGLAVFAFACDRGWRASVDGQPAILERADGSLCAVQLASGPHHVQLDYRPWSWPWVFVGPAIALAAMGWAVRRRSSHR